jgi:predicted secreted protein
MDDRAGKIAPMALRTGFGGCIVAAMVATAGCGGREEPPAATQAPAEAPIFKPVDPANPPTLPAPAPGAQPAPTPAPGGQSQPIAMVTDLASGWPVTLRVGDAMTARLTADRDAGLRWSLRPGSDAGIVSVAGEPAFEAAAGGPGVEVFRLVAVKPGQTTLTFDYRKGSDPAGLKSVSYPVTVQ